jgi:hypothetical protein
MKISNDDGIFEINFNEDNNFLGNVENVSYQRLFKELKELNDDAKIIISPFESDNDHHLKPFNLNYSF